MKDIGSIENFKILRTIWKNTFDKILEIKVNLNNPITITNTKIINTFNN